MALPHPTSVREAFRVRDSHVAEGNVDSASFPTQSQSTNDFPEVGQLVERILCSWKKDQRHLGTRDAQFP